MSLVTRNSIFDLDRFFNDAWPQLTGTENATFFAPRVDMPEGDGHYEITAELPGVRKEDIQLHVKDGVLTLEAETTQENREEDKGRVIRQERRYGRFSRSFNLGADVQESDIRASFRDGVLTLQAPKVEEQAPQRRRIEVS